MSCEGSKSGKVRYTDNNVTTDIIIANCPFTVSCSPTNACGKSGARSITYTCANPNPACAGSQKISNSFLNEVLSFVGVPQQGTYDGNYYNLIGTCPNGSSRIIYPQFSVACGRPTINTNDFTADNQTGLIVKDVSNNVVFNIDVSTCNYQVSCDNNCPDGYIKCNSDNYPGYCCIPCADIESKINNLTQRVRNLNG